jgi:hypothetical protein
LRELHDTEVPAGLRELHEQVCRLSESPDWQRQQEQICRLQEMLAQQQGLHQQLSWPPPVSRPESPPSVTLGTLAATKAANGASFAASIPTPESMPPSKLRRGSMTRKGRPPKFTFKEIKQLQKAYRAIRRKRPEEKQPDVFNELRAMLPQRTISDSTFRRHIVKPSPLK